MATLTQKQYSRALTKTKWELLGQLVVAYNQERHEHIDALKGLFGVLQERQYRDQLVKEKYTGLVPARSPSEARRQVVG